MYLLPTEASVAYPNPLHRPEDILAAIHKGAAMVQSKTDVEANSIWISPEMELKVCTTLFDTQAYTRLLVEYGLVIRKCPGLMGIVVAHVPTATTAPDVFVGWPTAYNKDNPHTVAWVMPIETAGIIVRRKRTPSSILETA